MLTVTPTPVSNPDTPFDRAAIQLVVQPNPINGGIYSTVSMRVTKYRVLPDGSVEFANNTAATFKYNNVEAAAGSDPDVATAFTAIQAAIQTFLAAKAV